MHGNTAKVGETVLVRICKALEAAGSSKYEVWNMRESGKRAIDLQAVGGPKPQRTALLQLTRKRENLGEGLG